MDLIRINHLARQYNKHHRIWWMRLRRRRKWFVKQSKFFKPVPALIESKHKSIWSALYPIIDVSYLRFYSNFSGCFDPRYIPQDIYTAVLERIVNDQNWAKVIKDKNLLDSIVSSENRPFTPIRNISGTFMDRDMKILTCLQAQELYDSLKCDLIVKPSIRSGGGRNVILLQKKKGAYHNHQKGKLAFSELLDMYKRNFTIQRKIDQHAELAKFHPHSVNTIRMHTYRSMRTEKILFFTNYFIMGKSGSSVSNTGLGGIFTGIDGNGLLGNFAASKSLEKYYEHPDTGIAFNSQKIPFYSSLKKLAEETALKIPTQRFIGFDMTLDSSEIPIVIEVNVSNVGIAQYVGGPLFGEFTEMIVEEVVGSMNRDNFRFIRT